jgi:nicotinate-nucleotide pyrophosphorylase
MFSKIRNHPNSGVADNSLLFESLIENQSKLKSYIEQAIHKVERTLTNKVEHDELLQVKETLNRKLDIATFLENKNEMLSRASSHANNR